MKCKDCKYREIHADHNLNKFNICKITHIGYIVSCGLQSDELVKDMDICYNCQYWIGGGDWGLSCSKNYYNCSTNGFGNACSEFCRKE